MVDHLRSRSLLQGNNIREWHQSTRIRAYIILPQIARRHTERLIGLHVHAIGTIVEVEIVHVLRSHVDAKRLRYLADGDAHRLRFCTIDLNQLLRIVGRETGEQSRQILALTAGRDDFVSGIIQVLQRVAAKVLQLELESTEATDTLNRGRLKGDNDRARHTKQLRRNSRHYISSRMTFPLTIVNRLQWRED